MDWSDIYESAHDSPIFSSLPPPLLPQPPAQFEVEWTCEENKVFEKTLSEFGLGTPAFFENANMRLPQKSLEDIQRNFQTLISDLETIDMNNGKGKEPVVDDDDFEVMPPSRPSPPPEQPPARQPRKTLSGNMRKRGIPWTEEEHQLFLMGLNKYGKGDWNSISRYYVVSKTSTQVASHAQKFYRRQNSTTPLDRRRPSIHDIQTVNVNIGGGGGGSGSQQMYYNNLPSLPPMMNSYNYYPNMSNSSIHADDHASNSINREMMMMMMTEPNYNSYSNAASAAAVDGSMMMMMDEPGYNQFNNVGSGFNNAAVDGSMMMNYPYGTNSTYNFSESNQYY
ncbi:uncharacterized protein LOC124932008 [Impatiens glandulifera]|uniref:uncharacterized protein LOC124932008 n=1 Tax=Impatiens glandulifera TaxID=253017 RepID=UPI001FB11946|nr:uncharacterized protein LOC124932008 [Impatiens glandulifera]